MNKDIVDELQDDWSEQRPDLDLEPMGIALRIQALAKILGDQTAARLQEFELHWWQYDALSTLRRQGKPYEMAATELADDNMLTSGAMTNRIDRLEDRNLVERQPHSDDRRRVMVRLTQKGKKVIDEAIQYRLNAARESLRELSPGRQAQLASLLREVMLSNGDSAGRVADR